MKKFKLILFVVLIANAFAMCNKDDKTVAPGITAAEVNNGIVAGNWHITTFNEAGTDHTSNVSGYNFMFNVDGKLITTPATIYPGKWNSTPESDIAKLILDFTTDSIQTELDSIGKNWNVLTLTPRITPTKIEMKRVDELDASIDFLTFEKI